MQRSVTGPFVAPLAPFNAQRLFAGASKGPRHATKGHGTLRCVPGTLQCTKAFCWCVEGSQACNEASRDPSLRPWHPSMHKGFWVVRRRVPGMQRRVTRHFVAPLEPFNAQSFWMVRRRVPGMQRSVTRPFVAPLAPFNAQRFWLVRRRVPGMQRRVTGPFVASKGPRHAMKGHGTLRCVPGTLQCAQVFGGMQGRFCLLRCMACLAQQTAKLALQLKIERNPNQILNLCRALNKP